MRERIEDTLLELIGIDSDNLADKEAVVGFTTRWLEGLGMEVGITGPGETPAIHARLGRGGIALSGHLDTVPVGDGWSVDQGQKEGRRLFGRGTSDMKGAVAVALEAACTLVEEDVPFYVMLTTDEEEGMLGALALTKVGLLEECGGVIIGEPTGMKVVSREKGVLRLRLTTRGRAGHSSQPWLGENAITKMRGTLDALGDLVVAPHSTTEERTASVTTIKGGIKNNVIPESCTAEIDIRFPPSESLDDIRALVAERLEGKECEVEATAELESFRTPEASGLLDEALRYLGTGTFPASFATEAARFAAVNREIVVCGPGTPETCHIADEWVDVENLGRFHDFLLHMARFVAQG